MSHKATIPILLALIAAHAILAIAYAVQTPYRTGGVVNGAYAKDIGAPDERQHANYIDRLLHGKGLPVFNPKDQDLYESYQSHQPPAYYALAALWSKVVEVPGVQVRRDGLMLRSINALIGAATIAGVFFLALWGYHRESVALTAAAIAALLPMHAALSGAISNDPLLICLCTWTLAVTALATRTGWTTKRAVAVGLLAGFALLTKTTAVALLPALLLAAFIAKPKAKYVLTTLGLVLLLAGPWWVRNQMLYGDPLAIGAFNEAFVGSPTRAFFIEQVIPQVSPDKSPALSYWTDWVGFWTARSFLGVFGYMDIWLTQSGGASGKLDENRLYWVAIAVFLVGFVGWVVSWRDSHLERARKVRFVNLLFFVLVVAFFLRFNVQYFQAQARYIFPAIGPIACGLAIGYHELAKKRRLVPLACIATFLLVVNVFALVRLGPQFEARTTPPPEASTP
jgi:4-amino-4-deoxy-L-arabinose transferase-like glycosyltransferase